jgi:hypothetical protein
MEAISLSRAIQDQASGLIYLSHRHYGNGPQTNLEYSHAAQKDEPELPWKKPVARVARNQGAANCGNISGILYEFILILWRDRVCAVEVHDRQDSRTGQRTAVGSGGRIRWQE